MTSQLKPPSNEDLVDTDTLSGTPTNAQLQPHLAIPKSVANESLALTGTSNASSDSIGSSGGRFQSK